MGWSPRNNEEDIISEINITPLTDVMLVLLVIFMVTTPLMMIGDLKIDLPKASTSTMDVGKGVEIAITENGLLSLNGEAIGMGELYDKLREVFEKNSTSSVFIRADKDARHGLVVEVLDTAKRAGASRLSIATEPYDEDRR